MSTALITHIRKFVELQNADAEQISNKIGSIHLKKKEILLSPGKICRANYFVVSGCMRLYFINRKDTEQITQFALENWWLTDYDSLDSKKPSRFYIQAVEDCELIVLDHQTEEELAKNIPEFERYLRIMLKKAFTAAQRRVEMIFSMTDEERYRNFAARFPEFNQRVPQYMVASYLGITPQFISRLRARPSRIS